MATLIEQFTASPATFPKDSYKALAAEVRERILSIVSQNGGHLASNLGVVELTIALLAIFNPKQDRVLFDVSHQGYAWKILTGRNDTFQTLRQFDGISGFLKREESPCDAFNAGHAGTAISAALGIAAARDKNDTKQNVIAVVGDASIANGLSLEAINNVSSTTKRLIVILNDNEMSISENVGALAQLFGRLLASRHYNIAKNRLEYFASKLRLTPLRTIYHRLEMMLKGLFVKNWAIEALGLRYVGPIDGHNFNALLSALTSAKTYDRPILVHIATVKGKGYTPAEREPSAWHGVSPFDITTAKPKKEPQPDYSSAFGDCILRLARADRDIVAITAAMRTGTGLAKFSTDLPEQFYDVGICEEHAITFAAGLAAAGKHPFVAIYSTFAQRAIDNFFHDVCLQNLPVTLCLDRAGVVGADGPTHHGLFDIALLRPLPNNIIMQPRNAQVLGKMLSLALVRNAPSTIRYPRGAPPETDEEITPPRELRVGEAQILSTPATEAKIWIWALGDMLELATLTAKLLDAEKIAAGIVDPQFIKPIDKALLTKQASSAAAIVTMENGSLAGGFGSAVIEALAQTTAKVPVMRFGLPDEIIPQGSTKQIFAKFQLTPQMMSQKIKTLITPTGAI